MAMTRRGTGKQSTGKQNASAEKRTRGAGSDVVRDPAKKKAVSAKSGKSGKPKGPAAKTPANSKVPATVVSAKQRQT